MVFSSFQTNPRILRSALQHPAACRGWSQNCSRHMHVARGFKEQVYDIYRYLPPSTQAVGGVGCRMMCWVLRSATQDGSCRATSLLQGSAQSTYSSFRSLRVACFHVSILLLSSALNRIMRLSYQRLPRTSLDVDKGFDTVTRANRQCIARATLRDATFKNTSNLEFSHTQTVRGVYLRFRYPVN